MFALTFAVTYILYLWMPVLAFWLSRKDSRGLQITALALSGVSLILAFTGLVSLVSELIGGANLGETPELLTMSWALIIVFYGGFTGLAGFAALRSYLYLFPKD
jgi:hypothetical protein